MKTVDLVYRTMYAELVQRSLDASFETDFSSLTHYCAIAWDILN